MLTPNVRRLDSNCHLPSPLITNLDHNTNHTSSSAWTPFLGNGTRAMAETGVLPCGEAVHGLETQLTIYVCIVRRCWSKPFYRPEVFHKFATPRASEGASNTRNYFPARIVTSATVNGTGTDSAMSKRSDLRARYEKKR